MINKLMLSKPTLKVVFYFYTVLIYSVGLALAAAGLETQQVISWLHRQSRNGYKVVRV